LTNLDTLPLKEKNLEQLIEKEKGISISNILFVFLF